MERSPLSLLVWFRAIQLVLGAPDISVKSLGEEVGIARKATIRRLKLVISEARSRPTAGQLLAGLNSNEDPACGGAFDRNLQNELGHQNNTKRKSD
jgi:hypothetical protein